MLCWQISVPRNSTGSKISANFMSTSTCVPPPQDKLSRDLKLETTRTGTTSDVESVEAEGSRNVHNKT